MNLRKRPCSSPADHSLSALSRESNQSSIAKQDVISTARAAVDITLKSSKKPKTSILHIKGSHQSQTSKSMLTMSKQPREPINTHSSFPRLSTKWAQKDVPSPMHLGPVPVAPCNPHSGDRSNERWNPYAKPYAKRNLITRRVAVTRCGCCSSRR